MSIAGKRGSRRGHAFGEFASAKSAFETPVGKNRSEITTGAYRKMWGEDGNGMRPIKLNIA